MIAKNEQSEVREGALYPYTSLSSALKVANAVKDLGGSRSEVQKSVLASHLKDSEKSAAFQQKIAGAKAFNLIQGRGTFSLTPISQRFYFPTTPTERSSAMLEVFASPIAFRELIKRFDGTKLPSREIFANLLHRELNVPDSWKDRVAAFFENSARLAGAIDGDGFLRYGTSTPLIDTQAIDKLDSVRTSSVTQSSAIAYVKPLRANRSDELNMWSFSYEGMNVRLETPSDLSTKLWEKLNAYVQLLKPTDDNAEQ